MSNPVSNDEAIIHTALDNALLGVSMKLHDQKHIDDIIEEMTILVSSASPVLAIELQKFLEDVCHGKFATNPLDDTSTYRIGSKHLFKTNNGKGCIRRSKKGYMSAVISWRNLIGLIELSDRRRFGFLNGDKPPQRSDAIWSEHQNIAPRQRLKRQFKPRKDAFWLWKPVQWWTPYSAVDKVLRSVKRHLWANTLRDKLGLYYTEFDSRTSEDARVKNMRFLVHIPTELICKCEHFRPNFADAGGYNRFAVHRQGKPPSHPNSWGHTADLGELHKSGDLADGFRERITPTLSSLDFNGAELRFDYVGEITEARGDTSLDNDIAFEQRLASLRTTHFPKATPQLKQLLNRLPPVHP